MWLLEGVELTEPPKGAVGFVYLITNLDSGKAYVGKKLFRFSRRGGARGKRRPARVFESDWRDYFGSSRELLDDVERLGEDTFKREVLHVCSTRGECSYMELVEQCARDVLRKPDEYYNAFIGGKVSRSHLPR